MIALFSRTIDACDVPPFGARRAVPDSPRVGRMDASRSGPTTRKRTLGRRPRAVSSRQNAATADHSQRHGDLWQRQATVRPGRCHRRKRHHCVRRAVRRTTRRRGRHNRRDWQVRDAGNRQHAYALARRAPAGRVAADSVRAQSLSCGGRDDRARGRRRLRQIETLAGGKQRARDHLASHHRLPRRQQGRERNTLRDSRVDPRHQAASSVRSWT
jgi:hypothetical protein